jgi:adenylate cyclase
MNATQALDAGGRAAPRRAGRVALQRRLHAAAGLFLTVFLVCHFTAHAAGLAGLAGLQAAGPVFRAVFGNPVGGVLLSVAFGFHYLSALVFLYERRNLGEMHRWEQVQIAFGLSIPPLLAAHLASAALTSGGYAFMLYLFFEADPVAGLRQLLLSIVVWTHAGIGFWAHYSLKPWFPRWRGTILAVLVGLPFTGLAGAIVAGREVVVRAEQPGWRAERIDRHRPNAETLDAIETWTLALIGGHLLIAGGVFAARFARDQRERRRGRVRVGYPDRRTAVVAPGITVLDASRAIGYPHASVCGGRGRCSTCRFRVVRGHRGLSPPEQQELKVLRHVGEAHGVRLACQARLIGDVEVAPLVAPSDGRLDLRRRDPTRDGEERDLAVLFADLRGFTSFAEHKLPFDTVFVLNRFAQLMQEAIEGAGGRVDKFIGDGVMAMFGMGGGEPCRSALRAAVDMQKGIEALNDQLGDTLGTRFRLGIGIHYGPTIIGAIGVGPAANVTAIGDTVNTASRLEQATKTYGAVLVVSGELLRRADLPDGIGERHVEAVRGRSEGIDVVAFAGIGELEAALAATGKDERTPALAV